MSITLLMSVCVSKCIFILIYTCTRISLYLYYPSKRLHDGSKIGPIAFALGSGWVRMCLKNISSWPREAPEQSVAKAPLHRTLSHGPTWPIWPILSLCTSNSILISIVILISIHHLDNINVFERAFAFCFCFLLRGDVAYVACSSSA